MTKNNSPKKDGIKTTERTIWLLRNTLCQGLGIFKSSTPFFISNIHLDIESIPFWLAFCIHNGLKMYGAAAIVIAAALDQLQQTHSHWDTIQTRK